MLNRCFEKKAAKQIAAFFAAPLLLCQFLKFHFNFLEFIVHLQPIV